MNGGFRVLIFVRYQIKQHILTALKLLTFIIAAVLSVAFLSNCNKAEELVAGFTYSADELTVAFSSSSTEADTYAWDFGDGATSTQENPSHTYIAAGTYSVELSVENDEGSDSETQSVIVEPPAPAAESPELSFGDADGAFYAINTVIVTETSGFQTTLRTGVGAAWLVDEGTDFVSVGDVSFIQSGGLSGSLDVNPNNSYTYVEDGIPPMGFSTSGGVLWSIAGGNGYSPVNGLSNQFPFPSTKIIIETSSTIDGASSYTLNHDGSINNADSTYYSIYGANASLLRRIAGSASA
tara:strand:+ start:1060 stop:1944 length:885 start_codon:yes stop_codon:yes gene_type:complete